MTVCSVTHVLLRCCGTCRLPQEKEKSGEWQKKPEETVLLFVILPPLDQRNRLTAEGAALFTWDDTHESLISTLLCLRYGIPSCSPPPPPCPSVPLPKNKTEERRRLSCQKPRVSSNAAEAFCGTQTGRSCICVSVRANERAVCECTLQKSCVSVCACIHPP